MQGSMFWLLIFFMDLGHCLACRKYSLFCLAVCLLTYLPLNLYWSDEQAEVLKLLHYAEAGQGFGRDTEREVKSSASSETKSSA